MSKKLSRMSDEKALSVLGEKCSKCGAILEDDPSDKRQTSKGIVCGDCYFDEADGEIKKNPIHHPRIPRYT